MKLELHPLRNLIADSLGGSTVAEWTATGIMLVFTTAVFLGLWRLVNRLAGAMARTIERSRGEHIKALKIQRQHIFREEDLTRILQFLARMLVWALRIVLIFIYVNMALSYFEWFHDVAVDLFILAGRAIGMVFGAFIDYLPNLLVVVIILLVARLVVRTLFLIFEGIRRERIHLPGFYPEWARTSFNLVRLVVIALTLVVVFPYLPGSKSPAFQGVSIFFGLLLSLGSTAAVSHVVASIVITYTRAFRIGDRVRIADTEGDVIERSAFVTRIRTPKNVEVSIPNAMVMANHIVNYSTQAQESGVMLHTTVTIGYDTPWPLVHEALIKAAHRTPHLESDPEPFVLQTALEDNYVAYEINAITRVPSGKTRIYSDLHANIQDTFREAGIEIMSPHYRAIRDGNKSTIPPEYAPPEDEESTM